MPKWNGLVPFDVDGNLVYNSPPPSPKRMALIPNAHSSVPGQLMRVFFFQNEVFTGTLCFDKFERGCSSVRALFGVVELQGPEYKVSMFLSDLERATHLFGWDGQHIHGRWTYRKKGAYYGICPAE